MPTTSPLPLTTTTVECRLRHVRGRTIEADYSDRNSTIRVSVVDRRDIAFLGGEHNTSGVYLLLAFPSRTTRPYAYVGKSTDLAKRFAEHDRSKPLWDRVLSVRRCPDDHTSAFDAAEIAWLEPFFIAMCEGTGVFDVHNEQRPAHTSLDDEAKEQLAHLTWPVVRGALNALGYRTDDTDPRIAAGRDRVPGVVIPSPAARQRPAPPTEFRKVLSPSDTGESACRQAGIWVPPSTIGTLFPPLDPEAANPKVWVRISDDSGSSWSCRLIHHNNRKRGGTRNEHRLTRTKPMFDALGVRAGDAIVLTKERDDSLRIAIVPAAEAPSESIQEQA